MFQFPVKKIQPQPGQESVWDYPRPPQLELVNKNLQVVFNQEIIANTNQGYRVLETSHPPVYYFPPEDIKMEYLIFNPQSSFCEWKGVANYYDLNVNNRQVKQGAWFYPDPTAEFIHIQNYVAFYPALMDGCYVDGEKVIPQPGGFYGGWITQNIVGPFKGDIGTWGW